ncbi:MAG: hypothetical protein ACFFE8_00230 [Candidatus Heimdallarchaeota archaeon]
MTAFRLQRSAKEGKIEYNTRVVNGHEFIRIIGGRRPFVRLVIILKKLIWIFTLLVCIAILDDIYPDSSILIPINSNLLNFLFEPIWLFFILPSLLIPIVIIVTAFVELANLYSFRVETLTGINLGEIRGQIPLFGRITWQILGKLSNDQVNVKLPGGKFIDESGILFNLGKIRTQFGLLRVKAPVEAFSIRGNKEYLLSRTCQITDSDNNLCFALTWTSSDTALANLHEYHIISHDFLSPFLTLTISVCLIEKFLSTVQKIDFHNEQEIEFRQSSFPFTSKF